jgi:hypothetical protein
MCIACELGLLLALDDLPDDPPPGFPRPRKPQDAAAGFACDAPPGEDAAPTSRRDERAP